MSKKFRSFTLYLTLFICMVAGVFSCKNFMQGQDLAEEMESVIKYVNSSKFTVYITPDDNVSGTLVSAGQKENCRVGDTISLEFKLADGYQFLGWKAVNKNDTSISYADYVTFKDATSTKTSVTLNKSNEAIENSQLLIRPVCAPDIGLDLNSCAPKNTSVAAPACNDSTITLCFTNNMSTSIDERLDEIKIYCGEEDYTEYFLAPEHSEENPKIIRIPSNPNKRITFESTTDLKELRVVIPSDFTYTTEDGEKELGKVFSFSYVVNYTTSAKTKVNFEIAAVDEAGAVVNTPDELGSLRIDGQTGTAFSKEYNISESKQVSFKTDSDYEFVGWVQSEDSEQFIGLSYPKDEYGEYLYKGADGKALYFDEESQTAAVLVKVYNSATDITVTAVVRKIPSHLIKVSSSEGKISPNGTESYQKGAKIPLTFSSDSEYCFTYWQVLVGGIVDTTQKYIAFENKDNPETTATFVKSPAANVSLVIEPVCEIRPVILSKSPEYTAAGVYRDARIKVMFDHAMDTSSIYYTSSEQESLIAKGYTPLYSDNKCYGYNNNGTITYKNISIIDSKTKNSILEHFGAPVFETEDVLVIPSNREDPMSPGSQAIVEISSKVSYKVTNKYSIPLATSIKWNYFVNSKVDTDLPMLTIKEFSSIGSKFDPATNPKRNEGTQTAISRTQDEKITITEADLYRIFASGRNIYLGAEVTDNGSGAAGFSMEVYRQNGETLTALPTVDLGLILSGSTGSYGTYEGSTLKGDKLYFDKETYPEGIYRLHFIGSDQNSNFRHDGEELADGSLKKYYYYVYFKDSSPAFTNANVTKIDNTKVSLTPVWTEPSETDFHSMEISYRLNSPTETPTVIEVSKGTLTKEISGLVPGNLYELQISALNNYANKTTVTLEKYTRPEGITNLTAVRDSTTPSNKINLSWTIPAVGRRDGFAVYYKTTATGASWVKYKELDANTTSVAVDGLKNGTKYEFNVVSFAGTLADENTTDSNTATIATQPAGVTGLVEVVGSKNKESVKLKYTAPSNINGIHVFKKNITANNTDFDWANPIDGLYSGKEIKSLIPGNNYEFCVLPYVNDGDGTKLYADKTNAASKITVNTKPNAATIVSATTKSDSSIELNWTNPSTADGSSYNGIAVSYGTTEWNDFVTNLTPDTTSVTITGLSAGTTYGFKVRTYSGNYTATNCTDSTSVLKATKPNGITGLKFSARKDASATLTWDSNTAQHTGYIVSYKDIDGANTWVEGSPSEGSDNSRTVTGLTPGHQYEFKVIPYKYETDNTADDSTSAHITGYTVPKPVQNLTATPDTTTPKQKVVLTWNAPSAGLYTKHVVKYKKSSASTYTKFKELTPSDIATNGNTIIVTGLSLGTKYDFVVDTYAGNYDSASTVISTTASVSTQPENVTNLKVSAIAKNAVTVSWSNPTQGSISGNYINVYNAAGTRVDSIVTGSTQTSYQVTGLTAGTLYKIEVLPYNVSTVAEKISSSSVSQYTTPNSPTNVTATRDATNPDTKIKVTWKNPTSGSYSGAIVSYGVDQGDSTSYTKVASYTTSELAGITTAGVCETTVTGLTAGTKYKFKVEMYAGAESDKNVSSVVGNGATRPNAITNLAVKSSGISNMSIGWTNPTSGSITGNKVYYKCLTDSDASWTLSGTITNTTTTTYSITGLQSGKQYEVKVISYLSTTDNEAADTASHVQRWISPQAIDITKCSVTSSDSGNATITFSAPTGYYTGYRIRYGTSVNTITTTTSFIAKSNSTYTVTGLTPGTKYYFKVDAVTGSGTTISASTTSSSYNNCITLPSIPTGVTVSRDTTYPSSRQTVSWTAVSTGKCSGYVVSKGTTSTPTGVSSTVTTNSASITSLTAGTCYYYRVRSYILADDGTTKIYSPYSTSAYKYTDVATPTNFTLSRNSTAPNTSIDLKWTNPTGTYTGVKVYYGTTTSAPTLLTTLTGKQTSYTVTGLSAMTQYYFKLVAYDSNSTATTTVSSRYTSAAAPDSVPSVYYDDGQGTVTLRFIMPSSTSYSGVTLYLGSQSVKVDRTSTNAGKWVTQVVKLSSFSRKASYAVGMAYNHKNDSSGEIVGVKKTATTNYSNSLGNIIYQGTELKNTKLLNAATASYTVTCNTTDYHWTNSCSKHSVDSNADEHSAFYGSSGSVTIGIYSIGQYEVTQELWYKIMGNNPSGNNNNNAGYFPVENMTWWDAILFCNKLSTVLGLTPYYRVLVNSSYVTDWTSGTTPSGFTTNSSSDGYRLPTAEEWEAAARGGSPSATTAWTSYYAGANSTLGDKTTRNNACWNTSNTTTTHAAGDDKPANRLGLYNMSGNVWEWTATTNGTNRFQKGGAYNRNTNCNVMGTASESPSSKDERTGLRLCRSITVTQ